MEQFVLGIFQEHLGKFIVGFHKEMVNANLLNGKGEINDISLNCSAINEQLNSITPLIELDSIHISKVSFQVTSWTNLRKAPIMVDIEHVTVHAAEPLHFLDKDKRRGIMQMTMSEMDRFFREQAQAAAELKKNKFKTTNSHTPGGPPLLASNPNKRGSYNLMDRIVDNLHLEIKSVFIDFQTWGKFKTRRTGPWTPPSVRVVLRNLKFTSVDEYGQEGTPDQIWAHNYAPQPRGQDRTLIVFKKTTMEYDFGVCTSDGQLFSLLKGGFGVAPPAVEAKRATAAAAAAAAKNAIPQSDDATGKNECKKETANDSTKETANNGIETTTTSDNKSIPVDTMDPPKGDAPIADIASSPTGASNPSSTGGFKTVTFEDPCTSEQKDKHKDPDDDRDNHQLNQDDEVAYNYHNNKVEVRLAVKRRVKDGALLAIQVDTTLSKLEMLIASPVVPFLVHLAAGMEYCFCKDRGFEDPLRHPDDHSDHNDHMDDDEEHHEIKATIDTNDEKDGEGELYQPPGGAESIQNIPQQVSLQATTISPNVQSHVDCAATNKEVTSTSSAEEAVTSSVLSGKDFTENTTAEDLDPVGSKGAAATATEIEATGSMAAAEPKRSFADFENDVENTSMDTYAVAAASTESGANSNATVNDDEANEVDAKDGVEITVADGAIDLKDTAATAADDGGDQHNNTSDDGVDEMLQIGGNKDDTVIAEQNVKEEPNDTTGEANSAAPQESTRNSFARLSRPFSSLFSRAPVPTPIPEAEIQTKTTTSTKEDLLVPETKPGDKVLAADGKVETVSLTDAPVESQDEAQNNGNTATGNDQAGESVDEVSHENTAVLAEEDVISLLAEAAGDTIISDDSISTTAMRQRMGESGMDNFAKSFTSLFSKSPQPGDTPQKATFNPSIDGTNGFVVDRPVIMLPNGLAIYEKMSLSLSVDRAIVRGTYPSTGSHQVSGEEVQQSDAGLLKLPIQHEGYMQADVKGVVFDMIWPKSNLEKGGYVQLSISHMSVQERFGQRIRTIVTAGVQQESMSTRPIEQAAQCPPEVLRVTSFPSFEDRALHGDPLDIRNTFPTQAAGLKMTIDVVRRKMPKTFSPPATIITVGDDANDQPTILRSSWHPAENNHANIPSNVFAGEFEDVLKVTNELGVDQFNIVVDSDSICRALRLALNEEGGGFDSRWFSGDWTDQLTTEMLVHPNRPLELEDHLQPKKEIFLDENAFISSDLFNVSARIKNCEMCVPAAIHQNARSCDIVSNVNEALLTVSSELSGKIGSSSNPDGVESESPDTINFPNDPSDIAYDIDRTEDPGKEQKSNFRFQLDLKGLSKKIIPVIPFHVGIQSQELCVPTDMKIVFCFEGEPPKSSDNNLIKMFVSSSVHLHRIHMNYDLDLLAGALSTCLHHCEVMRDTAQCAKILVPTLDRRRSDTAETDDAIGIKRSLKGRRVLVHKQFHQSRETGGLSIAACIKVDEYSCSLWRQNVSLVSPLLPPQHFGSANGGKGRRLVPVLKLVDFTAGGLDVGIEVAFRSLNRRVVAKCGVSKVQLKLCDLFKKGESDSISVAGKSPTLPDDMDQNLGSDIDFIEDVNYNEAQNNAGSLVPMIDVIRLGQDVPIGKQLSREESVLLRAEEQFGPFRSRSFSLDVATGGIVNLHIDQLEMIFLLVLEALLMPNQSRRKVSQGQASNRFPESSVGALFLSLFPATTASFPGILPLCHKAMAVAIPSDLRLLLVRLHLGGMLVAIPEATKQTQDNPSVRKSQRLALMLDHLELLTWYVSSKEGYHGEMLEVLAKKGVRWSSFLQNRLPGLSHVISSYQGMHLFDSANGNQLLEELVPMFEVSCTYLQSKLSTTIDNKLSIHDIDKLLSVCNLVRKFAKRGYAVYLHLRGKLVSMNVILPKASDRMTKEDSNKGKDPLHSACSNVENSISLARDLLSRLCRVFECHEINHTTLLRKREEELKIIRRRVFMKEMERFAAIALVSSQITGWLRMGGTHQSGQRMASTSTLWTYWAVLRHALIVLFNGPGMHQPIDFVLLRGAKLQALAGGRSKHDLKRAFSIVESTGKTRLFVIGSDSEYCAWTREIEKAIVQYNAADRPPPDFVDGVGGLIELSNSNLSGDDNSKSQERDMLQLSQRGSATAKSVERSMQKAMTSSAAAFQKIDVTAAVSVESMKKALDVSAAAFKKIDSTATTSMERSILKARDASAAALKAVSSGASESKGQSRLSGLGSVLRMSRGDDQKQIMENVSDMAGSGAAEIVRKEAEANIAKKQNFVDQASAAVSSVSSVRTMAGEDPAIIGTIPVEEEIVDFANKSPDNQSRRLQLRGKIAGVGQVTNRWGSAILSAGRRSSNMSPGSNDNPLHVISEKEIEERSLISSEDHAWTCPQCTFINEHQVAQNDPDIIVCGMCELPIDRACLLSGKAATTIADGQDGGDADKNASQAQSLDLPALSQKDSDIGLFRRSQSEVASGRKRVDSGDSDKALYLRQSSDGVFDYIEEDETSSVISDLALDDYSEAARTGGRRRGMRDRFAGALGSARRGRPNRTVAVPTESPESDGRGWFGRRGASSPNQDSCEEISKSSGPLKLKNTRVDASVEMVFDGTRSLVETPLHSLRGQWFALVKPEYTPLLGGERLQSVLATDATGNKPSTQADASTATSFGEAVDEEITSVKEQIKSIGGDADSVSKPGGSVKSSPSTGETAKKELFRIQLFHQGPLDDLRQPKAAVIKELSEVTKLHADLSETVSELRQHPLFQVTSFERTPSGELSDGLKNWLGLSPLDSLQISSKLLAGLLEPHVSAQGVHKAQGHYAEVIMEFLNSSLNCPLPNKGLSVLTDFLGVGDPVTGNLVVESSLSYPTGEESILRAASTLSDDGAPASSSVVTQTTSADMFDLLSTCGAELVRAESLGRRAHELLPTLPIREDSFRSSEPATVAFPEPLLPPPITDHLQEAMHVALMKVMAERDETHAQLVSSSVLHGHILEQEKKKIERLKAKLEMASKTQQAAATGPGLFKKNQINDEAREREKLRKKEMEMQQDSDAELIALCHQLSSEISSRTKAALEVIRLKESRSIEREHEEAEKDALKSELLRVKELLRIEQQKAKEAQEESNRWKWSYQNLMKEQNNQQNGR